MLFVLCHFKTPTFFFIPDFFTKTKFILLWFMKSHAKLIQYFLNIRSEAALSFPYSRLDFICSLSIKHGGSNVLEGIFCQN
jgi:hypothetical protein